MAGSLLSIPFDYLTLAEAAKALGVAEHRLIHAAGAGDVQLCVNIYARANSMSLSRIDDDAGDLSEAELSKSDLEEKETHDAARAAWMARCTIPMPHGIFEIDDEIARFFEMQDTHSVNLYEAYKFDERGWWLVKFFDDETETGEAVEIERSDLVVMREELARLLKSVSAAEPKSDKPLSERERNNLLRIIAALARESKIPLDEGKGGAQNIADAVARFPFDGPKEDTIRKVLAQVRKLHDEP